jgi:hypothetical protein
MRTFSAIIDLWPEPAPVTFAADLGEEAGTCRQWRTRNTIPPRVWKRTVEAAATRGLGGVTLDVLAKIAEQQAKAA